MKSPPLDQKSGISSILKQALAWALPSAAPDIALRAESPDVELRSNRRLPRLRRSRLLLRKSTGKLLPVVSQLPGGSNLPRPTRRLGIKGFVECPLKRSFDREPLTGGERLPVADKLRTDRGEAETPTENVPLGRFPTLLRLLTL